jgi:hypothetical protein
MIEQERVNNLSALEDLREKNLVMNQRLLFQQMSDDRSSILESKILDYERTISAKDAVILAMQAQLTAEKKSMEVLMQMVKDV